MDGDIKVKGPRQAVTVMRAMEAVGAVCKVFTVVARSGEDIETRITVPKLMHFGKPTAVESFRVDWCFFHKINASDERVAEYVHALMELLPGEDAAWER